MNARTRGWLCVCCALTGVFTPAQDADPVDPSGLWLVERAALRRDVEVLLRERVLPNAEAGVDAASPSRFLTDGLRAELELVSDGTWVLLPEAGSAAVGSWTRAGEEVTLISTDPEYDDEEVARVTARLEDGLLRLPAQDGSDLDVSFRRVSTAEEGRHVGARLLLRVTDDSGFALPGVRLRVTKGALGVNGYSGAEGEIELTVPPGTGYRLECALAGFDGFEIRGASLAAGLSYDLGERTLQLAGLGTPPGPTTWLAMLEESELYPMLARAGSSGVLAVLPRRRAQLTGRYDHDAERTVAEGVKRITAGMAETLQGMSADQRDEVRKTLTDQLVFASELVPATLLLDEEGGWSDSAGASGEWGLTPIEVEGRWDGPLLQLGSGAPSTELWLSAGAGEPRASVVFEDGVLERWVDAGGVHVLASFRQHP